MRPFAIMVRTALARSARSTPASYRQFSRKVERRTGRAGARGPVNIAYTVDGEIGTASIIIGRWAAAPAATAHRSTMEKYLRMRHPLSFRWARAARLFAVLGSAWFVQGTAAAATPTADTPVCFYEHVNYGGASLCTAASQRWIGSGWNDRVSSVKLAPGYGVTLHEHVDATGRSLAVQADTPNLVPLQFNDAASSFTVARTPAAPGCDANVAFGEQPGPTVVPSAGRFCPMRGLWVWNTRDVFVGGPQHEAFLRSAAELRATDVFLYLTGPHYVARRNDLRALIATLKASGIAAWGLDGSRGYFSDVEGPTRLYASVDGLVQYNQGVSPHERFVGFQSDMEPQDYPQFRKSFHNEVRDDQLDQAGGGVWQGSQAMDREMLMRDWLEIHNACRNKLQPAGLKFSAAMPFWTEDYLGAPVMVTYQGRRETVGTHMMRIVHDYVIMSYNTDPDNAAARVAKQARMASALPFERRPRVSGAVETHLGVERNVSYADTPGKNSRRVVLDDMGRIATLLNGHPAFGGVSVHDWEGWRLLPP
ncbi:MAG: hypothetical protein M1823_006352 [Watsoniomyces obsoletus]|nr:MAG: hypothetical protein M1823_006352 [Watsoniomyces obsoletus]